MPVSSMREKKNNKVVLKKHDSSGQGVELLKKGIIISSAMLLAGITVSNFGEELSSLVGYTWTAAVNFVAGLI